MSKCKWTADKDPDCDGLYQTGCGDAFILECGTPAENNYKHCPNCGKEVESEGK